MTRKRRRPQNSKIEEVGTSESLRVSLSLSLSSLFLQAFASWFETQRNMRDLGLTESLMWRRICVLFLHLAAVPLKSFVEGSNGLILFLW
ncbi:hypothetical protein ACFX13_037814 [Malus domestica]